ncbi:uncharacterized protein LOC119636885 isoform X2 [Glossina fuscipes]|uniref:Uncharacterized protein LOC119636885 isoform X2 n=1 Tax=Glossina fuscipes TaxID=7396 RepID=A0A9C5YVV4_9MUSC|nr:uncharacterized protein LOC119636885 isoform X2 [Glossina fuscipes]
MVDSVCFLYESKSCSADLYATCTLCAEMSVIENLIVYIIALAILYAIYQFIILIIRVWKVCRLKRRQSSERDRQGNVFTIHDENNQVNRYNDIFYIETNNADAARARAQLEKDDKDLPTYEEVMRITSAANSASTSIMAATSTSNVNTTNTIDSTLALPPYSAIFCNDRTGAVNSCERSAALSSPNVASTSTEHTTIALSSSLGFSNTISTQTQTAAPPSSSSNV